MITTKSWHHGSHGVGISWMPGLFHVHGFGWSLELEWGDKDKGAACVERSKRRQKEREL